MLAFHLASSIDPFYAKAAKAMSFWHVIGVFIAVGSTVSLSLIVLSFIAMDGDIARWEKMDEDRTA